MQCGEHFVIEKAISKDADHFTLHFETLTYRVEVQIN